MIHQLLTVESSDKVLLRKPAKKVKNVRDVEIAVQTMKAVACKWESENLGQRCEGLAATQVGIRFVF